MSLLDMGHPYSELGLLLIQTWATRPRMTQRYAHLSPDYMAASVGKLDGIMGGILPAPQMS